MMRIILIADDPNSTRDIQNRLQRASYDVTTMTVTADEVITRADELRPDVILMDVGLKGETDGVEVARQIKSLHDIPIIFITANADEATVRRAIAAEPDGFLIMPLDELELRAAIEIAIHRHGTEAKARESDRRIRELTESLSEVIFETDMAGNITFVNHAGLKEFGYTKEQVEAGMTLYDFIPPDKQEEIRESIAQAVIDEPSEWIAVPGLRRDGSTFPVSARASLIVREGVPVGIRGIALNVTEQKRAEQQREESERQLRELTDSLPEIMFETDVGGTFTFLNPKGLDSLGYTEADLKKQLTIEDLIIPADHARARENFRKRLGGTAAVWAEYTVQRKDGGTFPLSIRTTAVIRDGVVVGARGIAIDITERKHLEEELQIAASFPSENPDPVLRLSGDGALLYANDAGRKVLGEYLDNLDTAGGPMLALLRDAAADALKANAVRQIEVDVADHTLEFSVAPIVERQHVNFYGVDITARKHAEELAREHAQSMEIVNQIAAAGNRATSVESFAETVTTLTLELMHLDVGALYLVDDDARCANLQYVRGVPETTIDAIRTISLDDTLCAAFCDEGRAPHIEDQDESCVLCAAVTGLASHARAPLYHHDACIGELHVGSLTRHAFSQAEKELLTAVSNEVGTVIAKLQADDALKESEQRFRALFESSPIVQLRYDVDGHPVYVNSAALELLGIVEVTDIQHISIFSSPRVSEANKAQLRAGHTIRYEQRYNFDEIKKRGDFPTTRSGIRFVDFHIAPLSNVGTGKVEGYIGQVADITERKRADQKLRESEKRIRELTDALPVLVYEADATGRITFANATSFDLFGYTKEELEAGISVFELVTDADKERADTAFRRRGGGEDVGRMEYIGLRKDGSTFPVSALGAPIMRDGAVVGVRGIAIDITERKRDEQKLRESEKRIRELTDALPVVVYETDETGRLTFVNATSSDLFGYTKEELEAGMSLFQLIAPADRERARTVFRRRMSAEDVDRVEYTGLRKDGSTFRTSIRAVIMRQDAAVVGLRGIIVDITERKQTEEALAWESAINLAIAHLYTPLIAPTSTLEDIALAILDEAKHLTGSEHGLVSLIDPVNKDMIAFGLTQMMPSECAIPGEKRQIRFPIGADGSYPALWGHALNTKEGFYTNAPATHPASRGTPDGHTPLAQFLAAPALVGEEVVGQIALANPGRDYTERDLTAVERLANVYALAVIRTQEEDAIKSALEERETLLKEIHHRVKNNMQIISSLLNLQATQAKEPETVDMLNESQSRIRSMALIHEQLYRSSSLADSDFAEYVESLTNALLRMYNVAEGEIAITTDIENVQLGVDTAVPCALIVNELVSNCLKHAFTDRKTGEVAIAIHQINGTYELTVADNGVGPPPDLDIRETNTLGLQLVTGLVNQLDGTITLDRTKGTTFIITFKPEGARVVRSRGK